MVLKGSKERRKGKKGNSLIKALDFAFKIWVMFGIERLEDLCWLSLLGLGCF